MVNILNFYDLCKNRKLAANINLLFLLFFSVKVKPRLLERAVSSAGERLPYKQDVTGSNPVPPTMRVRPVWTAFKNGAVAQFGLERCPVKAEAAGSSPVGAAMYNL